MSPDRLRQLAIALISLLVLWGVASLLRRGSDGLGGAAFSFPELDSTAVTEVSLVGGGDSIVLTRHPDGWRVDGFAADAGMVAGLLTGLAADTAAAELVSVNESSHERMGVAGANGRLVTLRGGGGDIGSIIFGNNGPTFGSLFARSPASASTYLVRTALANQIRRRRDDWRDRRILEVNPDSIAAVDVVRRPGGYRLVRGDSAWSFADGLPADSGAVARMIERFRLLQASGFAADSDQIDLANPDLTVSLRGPEGAELAALVFDSAGTDFWVRRSAGGTVYKLANWSVRQLAPVDSLLRVRE